MAFSFSSTKDADPGIIESLEELQASYEKMEGAAAGINDLSRVMDNVSLALGVLGEAKNATEALSIMNADGALGTLLNSADKLADLESLSTEALASVKQEVIAALESQDASLWQKFKDGVAKVWQAIKDFFRRMWWRIRSFIGPNREYYKTALAVEDMAKKISSEAEKIVDDFVKDAPAEMSKVSEAINAATDKFMSDLEAEVNRMSKMSYDELIKECEDKYESFFGEKLRVPGDPDETSDAVNIPQEDAKVSPPPYANEGLTINLNVEGGILEYKDAINGLSDMMRKMKDGGIDPLYVTQSIRQALAKVHKYASSHVLTNEELIKSRQDLIDLLSKVEGVVKPMIGQSKDGLLVKKFDINPNEPSYDIEIDLTPPKDKLGAMGWDFHKMIEFSKLYADTIGKFDVNSFERHIDTFERIVAQTKFADDVSEENKAWFNRVMRFMTQEARDSLKIAAKWQQKLATTSKMCLILTGKISNAFRTAIPKRLKKD